MTHPLAGDLCPGGVTKPDGALLAAGPGSSKGEVAPIGLALNFDDPLLGVATDADTGLEAVARWSEVERPLDGFGEIIEALYLLTPGRRRGVGHGGSRLFGVRKDGRGGSRGRPAAGGEHQEEYRHRLPHRLAIGGRRVVLSILRALFCPSVGAPQRCSPLRCRGGGC